jgi:hypothetical protein
VTLKKQICDLELRIKGLERKLDVMLNILVSDLYEDEFQEHPMVGPEEIHNELTKLN